MRPAMIFPGQGSQFPGMGKDLVDEFQLAARMFEEADDTLGFSLSKLCFEGENEILTETRNAQPAILLHSIVVASILREEAGIEPSISAGHSLGEYSALVAAGVMKGMDALRIVRKRGELMFEAGLKQPGTMAAIIGLDREGVEKACGVASTDGMVAVVANINSPGQIVISGHIDAVVKAMESAQEGGAKKTVRLNVSGAFHSPLVAPAQVELVEYIRSFELGDAETDVVCNADARAIRKREDIIDALSRQLTSPVLWSDSMNVMCEAFEGLIVETGPGKVLSGLMRRIDKSRETLCAGTASQVSDLIGSAG
ncbi:MAG: ACP S-malonyltransferase [Candidatus Krumholzibacteria bacterium]|nr:ACP S-malonyltransferase [Candidatus Krumholzibacteria bacterium]